MAPPAHPASARIVSRAIVGGHEEATTQYGYQWSERYERKSVGISTNLVFSDWVRIFKSPLTTMAAIDRVVHHSVILDLMPVESFRARTALDDQRRPPAPADAPAAEVPT